MAFVPLWFEAKYKNGFTFFDPPEWSPGNQEATHHALMDGLFPPEVIQININHLAGVYDYITYLESTPGFPVYGPDDCYWWLVARYTGGPSDLSNYESAFVYDSCWGHIDDQWPQGGTNDNAITSWFWKSATFNPDDARKFCAGAFGTPRTYVGPVPHGNSNCTTFSYHGELRRVSGGPGDDYSTNTLTFEYQSCCDQSGGGGGEDPPEEPPPVPDPGTPGECPDIYTIDDKNGSGEAELQRWSSTQSALIDTIPLGIFDEFAAYQMTFGKCDHLLYIPFWGSRGSPVIRVNVDTLEVTNNWYSVPGHLPTNVTSDNHGNIWVTLINVTNDLVLHKLDSNGNLLGSWQLPNPSGDASEVTGATEFNDILYYIDIVSGTNSAGVIKRWDLINGIPLTDFTQNVDFNPATETAPTRFGGGIRVTEDGTVYVIKTQGVLADSAIRIYLPDASSYVTLNVGSAAPGQLGVLDLDIGPDGQVYISCRSTIGLNLAVVRRDQIGGAPVKLFSANDGSQSSIAVLCGTRAKPCDEVRGWFSTTLIGAN